MAALAEPRPTFAIEEFLEREHEKTLLRFTTAGSVDDGKSTLIGRLLYDSRSVYEDQIKSIARSTHNGGMDLSLLTDGLRAEREQGITIDVAYRYFSTPQRKFIIADTPGHEQYTRNMATGASTADLAIILIDARNGVMPQSRRHAYISALLGIPRFVVAVNKMDLVAYNAAVFDAIEDEFTAVLNRLGVHDAHFIPISALAGENVVRRGKHTPWYDGPSLLEYLETVEIEAAPVAAPFRFPVQRVIRPHQDFRGYAGQIASGTVRPGDRLRVAASGRQSRVKSIETWEGPLDQAHAPMSVVITLEDEVDISRGDLLTDADERPTYARSFEAHAVWMHENALDPAKPYLLKHASQTVPARVVQIVHAVDIGTLDARHASTLPMNGIGLLRIETSRPIPFDAYRQNRAMGAAILIDPGTNATAGALMIERAFDRAEISGPVTATERVERFGHIAAVVRLGRRDHLAALLERRLFERGANVAVLHAYDESFGEALKAAGLLALVTSDNTPTRAWPHDDEAAVAAVIEHLESSGIIRSGHQLAGGEGI
jgi:sulfate adenylyltransferase large subunit